jgi:CheY-like chemotaxis protein
MAQPPGKVVLIVEDDDLAREGLTAILQREGFTPVSVKNCKEAEACFQAGLTPSLVLLDMLLPESDGWQFFARRRQSPALASAPVIVMTGLAIASDEWARSLGALGLLHKPIDLNTLLDVVRRYVG